MSGRSGVTLLELVVALAILAVAAGVTGLALRPAAPPDPDSVRAARIVEARRQAMRTRRPVRLALPLGDGRVAALRALPDGRVLADSTLGLDPLNGRPYADR